MAIPADLRPEGRGDRLHDMWEQSQRFHNLIIGNEAIRTYLMAHLFDDLTSRFAAT